MGEVGSRENEEGGCGNRRVKRKWEKKDEGRKEDECRQRRRVGRGGRGGR